MDYSLKASKTMSYSCWFQFLKVSKTMSHSCWIQFLKVSKTMSHSCWFQFLKVSKTMSHSCWFQFLKVCFQLKFKTSKDIFYGLCFLISLYLLISNHDTV